MSAASSDTTVWLLDGQQVIAWVSSCMAWKCSLGRDYIDFEDVKGHSKDPWNDLADVVAKTAARRSDIWPHS